MATSLRDTDTPPTPGEVLLGYMATAYEVISYDPETEIAVTQLVGGGQQQPRRRI